MQLGARRHPPTGLSTSTSLTSRRDTATPAPHDQSHFWELTVLSRIRAQLPASTLPVPLPGRSVASSQLTFTSSLTLPGYTHDHQIHVTVKPLGAGGQASGSPAPRPRPVRVGWAP